MDRKIILIAGQMQMAKTTVANYIYSKLPAQEWNKTSFADPIKKEFCKLFGVDLDFIEKWKNLDEIPPGFNTTIRKGLQIVGDGFRAVKSDVWIQLAYTEEGNLIVADGRYLNELHESFIRGAIIILLYREGYRNYVDNESESQIGELIDWFHDNVSEGIVGELKNPIKGAECVSIFLKNTGDLQELYGKIDEIVIPYLKLKNITS